MVSQCDMACDTGQTPMNQKVPNIGSVLSLTVAQDDFQHVCNSVVRRLDVAAALVWLPKLAATIIVLWFHI
jgi:hypothetical protein